MDLGLKPNTPVLVTLLGRRGESAVSAWVREWSGTRLRLSVPQPVPCGRQVKVETFEVVVLGTVNACEPAGDAYEVSFVLSRALSSFRDLLALNRALLGEDYREPAWRATRS